MDDDQIATTILGPIWRGIPSEYKSRYRANIWQQFEDHIRSAAYTARLGVWYDTICRKLGVRVRVEDIAMLQAALQCDQSQSRAVLQRIREQATLLVLLVRVANEERKAAYATASLFEINPGEEAEEAEEAE